MLLSSFSRHRLLFKFYIHRYIRLTPKPKPIFPTLVQNFTEEKKQLEKSWSFFNSPQSLYHPTSSHLAKFCVHLPPQPPATSACSLLLIPLEIRIPILTGICLPAGDPEKPWQEVMASGFLLWGYPCFLDTMMKIVHLTPCLLDVLKKRVSAGKIKIKT